MFQSILVLEIGMILRKDLNVSLFMLVYISSNPVCNEFSKAWIRENVSSANFSGLEKEKVVAGDDLLLCICKLPSSK